GLEPFLAGSLTVLGYERVETTARSPHPFAGREGVLYTLTLERPGGMKIDALALASAKKEVLDLIIFLAPREHYFPAREAEVRRLFASVARPP
ncbi:MAG: hypothetical protein ACOC20_01455, partial [Oceanicaulis sp.]